MNTTSSLISNTFFLSESPLFEGLEQDIIDGMIGSLRKERWPRHRVVMTSSDTLKRFYILVNGRVKVFNQNPDTGREITLFLLGPGDGFNVISLLDGAQHVVTVETLDEVEALSAPVAQWWAWMETYPVLHRAMHRYVNLRMQQLSELVSDLALHDTMTRLVHLILRHFANDDNKRHSHLNLIKNLSHVELAHMIGTVRVVVNRLLSELRQEGIVDTEGGELRVLDMEKLLLKAEQHIHLK